MSDSRSAEIVSIREWFPDDQHGYSIALCVCEGGPYLGARQMGTPCCCERCGRLTRDQWDFLVERATANLRMQYEASQGALGDLLTEHRELREAIDALAAQWEAFPCSGDEAIRQLRALNGPITPPTPPATKEGQ